MNARYEKYSCAFFYGRRTFAHKVLEGAEDILRDYRKYLINDAKLNSEYKRLRLRTADEFENFLKEGAE